MHVRIIIETDISDSLDTQEDELIDDLIKFLRDERADSVFKGYHFEFHGKTRIVMERELDCRRSS